MIRRIVGPSAGALVRFLLGGTAAAGVSFLVFSAVLPLLGARRGAAAGAQAVAFASGMLVAYLLNRYWAFHSTGMVRRQVVRFVTEQMGMLLLTSALIEGGVELGLRPKVSWLVVTAGSTLINFAAQRLWVFREDPASATPAARSDLRLAVDSERDA